MKRDFKPIYIIIFILLLISIAVLVKYNNFISLQSEKEKLKDIKQVEQCVVNYYKNLISKKYAKTLELIDYGDTSYKDDLKWLKENADIYNIETIDVSLNELIVDYEHPQFICPLIMQIQYSPKLKVYKIFTSGINVDFNGKKTALNERVYLKKISNDYRIIYIDSFDEKINHRINEGNFSNDVINDNTYKIISQKEINKYFNN